MLLLHGALATAAQFDPILPLLPAKRRYFPMHFAGHGPLPPQRFFSLGMLTGSVLATMNENKLESAHFFGYSLGGYVALYMASNYPERVKSVVTLGTKMDWDPEIAERMNRKFEPERIEAKAPAFAADLAAVHNDWKAVCQSTIRLLEELGDGGNITDSDFSRILCPVTIALASEDTVVSEEESRRVATMIPNGELTIVPGAHAFESVDPKVVAKLMRRYAR